MKQIQGQAIDISSAELKDHPAATDCLLVTDPLTKKTSRTPLSALNVSGGNFPGDFVQKPTSGSFDTIWLFDGNKLVPSNIESYIPDVPSSNDYDLVSIRAFLDVIGNAKIQGNLHVMGDTVFDKKVSLGDIRYSDDVPLFLYRGNGRTGKDEKWGGLAIGMTPDGEYAIIEYFNSASEKFALYINENGLHVKNAAGVLKPLSFGHSFDVSDFLPFSIDGKEVAPGDKFLLTTNNAQAASPASGSTSPAPVSTPPTVKNIINSASFVAGSDDPTKNIKNNWQALSDANVPITLHVNEEEDTGNAGQYLNLDMLTSDYTATLDMIVSVSARVVMRTGSDTSNVLVEWGMFAERFDSSTNQWVALPDSHIIEPVKLLALELEDALCFFTVKLNAGDKLRFRHYVNDSSYFLAIEATPSIGGLPARSGVLINIVGVSV